MTQQVRTAAARAAVQHKAIPGVRLVAPWQPAPVPGVVVCDLVISIPGQQPCAADVPDGAANPLHSPTTRHKKSHSKHPSQAPAALVRFRRASAAKTVQLPAVAASRSTAKPPRPPASGVHSTIQASTASAPDNPDKPPQPPAPSGEKAPRDAPSPLPMADALKGSQQPPPTLAAGASQPRASGYRGVCWHRGQGRWQVSVSGVHVWLGYYDDERHAATVHDATAVIAKGR